MKKYTLRKIGASAPVFYFSGADELSPHFSDKIIPLMLDDVCSIYIWAYGRKQ